jgi:hypothetical protein
MRPAGNRAGTPPLRSASEGLKPPPIWRGTRGSNPFPSSGESETNRFPWRCAVARCSVRLNMFILSLLPTGGLR